jgi:hypothetical protein
MKTDSGGENNVILVPNEADCFTLYRYLLRSFWPEVELPSFL